MHFQGFPHLFPISQRTVELQSSELCEASQYIMGTETQVLTPAIQVCFVPNELPPQSKISFDKVKVASNPRPPVNVYQVMLFA